MTKRDPIKILVVEDDPDDVELTKEALLDAKVVFDLNVVADGVAAMEFLRQEGRYRQATRPDLILLDLNLPRKDGREVLAEIKGDEDLKRIPVVVLTTSSAEEDVMQAYNSHVNCFITKPADFAQFIKVVKSIEDFWFTVVKLPRE
ncbi:MAG: response regulator [Desulfobacterales bacterium]|nr:response regulator [Pseudomonadota bacterium]MBU4354722.1 response regulator [Pseudomonadota bacterium]MCG2771628.1 response regulator [Desulfobacterales bacterium]